MITLDQKELLEKEDWDVLVVLDACRFDFFQSLIEQSGIEGRLRRANTGVVCTNDWLNRCWPDVYKNVAYVSGNPFVTNVEVKGYRGVEHFKVIVQAWEFGWDEDLKTVLPGEVCRSSLLAVEEFPEMKQIVHFMQPHPPYIGKVKLGIQPMISRSALVGEKEPSSVNFPKDMSSEEKVRLVRRAYASNLELVLRHVKNLIADLKEKNFGKKLVITADHGELLGEYDLIGHPEEADYEILKIVPWFEVDLGGNEIGAEAGE